MEEHAVGAECLKLPFGADYNTAALGAWDVTSRRARAYQPQDHLDRSQVPTCTVAHILA